jgi:hypothetical protein
MQSKVEAQLGPAVMQTNHINLQRHYQMLSPDVVCGFAALGHKSFGTVNIALP